MSQKYHIWLDVFVTIGDDTCPGQSAQQQSASRMNGAAKARETALTRLPFG